jgi:hypothetical protein
VRVGCPVEPQDIFPAARFGASVERGAWGTGMRGWREREG